MPLVTVLLPVYNAEKFLAEAIQSVLDQSFRDFELLAIDDGSTDRSAEIIHQFSDPRIRYLRNDQNLRLIKTLNRGLIEAKGEFIARMDSDDVCFPERLERQLQFFDRKPQTVILGSFAIRIDEAGVRGSLIQRPVGRELAISAWLPTPLLHSTVMMRKSVAAQGFAYDESCLHCEDYDLWIRALKAGLAIDNLPAPLLYYRTHGGGVTFQYREQQLTKSFQVFQKHFPVVDLSPAEYCALVGAKGSLTWRRRLQILRALAAGESFTYRYLYRQLLIHLRHLGWGK